jgi:hypothetical protein
VRFQSRSCGRHGRRRRGRSGTGAVDPTSSVRYTGRIMHNVNIDTNISIVTHPVSGVCTLAVQWESMRIVCRRSWVQNLFASFLNPDQERYELVCFGMCWYVPVCFSMNWYELVCTDIYLLVTVYSSMYKYTHSPARLRSLSCPSMDRWRMLGSSNCTSLAPYSAFILLHLTTW